MGKRKRRAAGWVRPRGADGRFLPARAASGEEAPEGRGVAGERAVQLCDSPTKYGTLPAVRRMAERNVSDEQKARFLEELNETCNVTLSAERAEISKTHVYRMRKLDPLFAEAWDTAKANALVTLEWSMIDRAINGDRKDSGIVHSDQNARFLLTRHSGGPGHAGSSRGCSTNCRTCASGARS